MFVSLTLLFHGGGGIIIKSIQVYLNVALSLSPTSPHLWKYGYAILFLCYLRIYVHSMHVVQFG